MNKIKLNFAQKCDIKDIESHYFIRFLDKYYNIEISNSPDYVFCFDYDESKAIYYDCVRILCIGENIRPNFNLYDYAIGFDYMQFGDRYLRLPLYVWYDSDFQYALHKHEKGDIFYKSKNKFCNFIVSNGSDADPIRNEFFYELSQYDFVESAGRYLNNLPEGKPVPLEKKKEYQEQFKFSIAFENSSTDGYTTEKIIQAWSAGTIPIYWGNTKISKEFNPESFINMHDYENISQAIKRIDEINTNEMEFLRIANQPIITKSSEASLFTNDKYLLDFFDNIFSQPPQQAIRRYNKTGWGKLYQDMRMEYAELKKSKLVKATYKLQKSVTSVKRK